MIQFYDSVGLDRTGDSMDMNLSKLWVIVEDRGTEGPLSGLLGCRARHGWAAEQQHGKALSLYLVWDSKAPTDGGTVMTMPASQRRKKAVRGINWAAKFGASLLAQKAKNLCAMQETQVLSLGQEDPLEKELATHSSILTWRIPWSLVGYSSWGRKELDTTITSVYWVLITVGTMRSVLLVLFVKFF